jgi:hypothetical protein
MKATHWLRIAGFIIVFAGVVPTHAEDATVSHVQDNDKVLSVQDAEKLFPDAVRTRADGTKAIDYASLSGALAKTVLDLNARVERLEVERQAPKVKAH